MGWSGGLDVFELCGYAIILSALDRTDYWSAYREVLDRFFTPDAEGCSKLNAYVALARYCKRLIAITPRSILRFYWTRALEDKLESSGLGDDRGFHSPYYPQPTHRNATVRAMLHEYPRAESMFNLFLAIYASGAARI